MPERIAVGSGLGRVGVLEDDESTGQLVLHLDTGERLPVKREQLQEQQDGSVLLTAPLDEVVRERDEVVRERASVPVVEEQLRVEKSLVSRGKVQVHITPSEREAVASVPVSTEHVEVSRVRVGRVVDVAPAIREEGDTVIVPVLEEVLVVQKQLMVREEIHLRRQRTTRTSKQSVRLRSEQVRITRNHGPR